MWPWIEINRPEDLWGRFNPDLFPIIDLSFEPKPLQWLKPKLTVCSYLPEGVLLVLTEDYRLWTAESKMIPTNPIDCECTILRYFGEGISKL